MILDRDGTVNVERHYLSSPDQVELLPGTLPGLARMSAMGLGLVVVSNQSGLARGLFDFARLQEIHDRLTDLLATGGVALDGIFVCPHHPDDGCSCRKPKPGLVLEAASQLGFEPSEAFVIGDNECDLELGRRIDAFTILVTTGYGCQVARSPAAEKAHAVVRSLEGAAETIQQCLDARSVRGAQRMPEKTDRA